MEYFREIGRIRRENDVYKEGDFNLLYLDSSTLVFERFDDCRAYITFVNNSKQDRKVEFSKAAASLIFDKDDKVQQEFTIPAYTAHIFKTERDGYISF